jgi:hypothetical protein
VIVDGMGCSGGWKTTAAATKHSIHSTSLRIYYLLSVPQTQRSNQSNHKPATAAAAVEPAGGGLQYHCHMHITRNNNKDKQLVVMHKTLHHIAGK